MNKIAPLLAGLALPLVASQAEATECGTVSIAEMNWASAGAMAQIDKIILEEGYGCDVELVIGDTIPTFTSMREKGEPDMAPEIWTNSVRQPLDEAVAAGELILAGEVLLDGGEQGFWIPTALAEEHNLKTVEDVLSHPELFPGAEDESKGAFFTCPAGWDCGPISAKLLEAWAAEKKGFEVVATGSGAGLDGSIARAFEQGKGWFGYYWSPTAMMGKYDLTLLDFGVPFDDAEWERCTSVADCTDPKKNAWQKGEVYTIVTTSFAEKAGVAMEYVNARGWSSDTASKVLAWMETNQANNEDGAYYFLENFEDVWTQWMSPDVAVKVKSAL
ncbi:ABC transporter substrate-binding protein [Roseibium polysiphoniae]|uniref:ABC transporter substrate-binding protein n=1 Tax=Roseibium polysiphoniae TaxID=2571221 RepID=A0A944GSA4_9HYPH|nr:ABC transporter substrate-binding protein [Roseibium polysiphoniae]MBS8259431.1 ABC transporter substrate-binding protein [Roseibium polysiphoniae]